jgi:5-carboxymethyl-2-hydroxymuconate isomerase
MSQNKYCLLHFGIMYVYAHDTLMIEGQKGIGDVRTRFVTAKEYE